MNIPSLSCPIGHTATDDDAYEFYPNKDEQKAASVEPLPCEIEESHLFPTNQFQLALSKNDDTNTYEDEATNDEENGNFCLSQEIEDFFLKNIESPSKSSREMNNIVYSRSPSNNITDSNDIMISSSPTTVSSNIYTFAPMVIQNPPHLPQHNSLIIIEEEEPKDDPLISNNNIHSNIPCTQFLIPHPCPYVPPPTVQYEAPIAVMPVTKNNKNNNNRNDAQTHAVSPQYAEFVSHCTTNHVPQIPEHKQREQLEVQREREKREAQKQRDAALRKELQNMSMRQLLSMNFSLEQLLIFGLMGRFMAHGDGSRYIQRLLDDPKAVSLLVHAFVTPGDNNENNFNLCHISNDYCGNYIISKLFECCSDAECNVLLDHFLDNNFIVPLSLEKYGFRVVMNMLARIDSNSLFKVINAFEPELKRNNRLLKSYYSGQVIQKILEFQPPFPAVKCIADALEADLGIFFNFI